MATTNVCYIITPYTAFIIHFSGKVTRLSGLYKVQQSYGDKSPLALWSACNVRTRNAPIARP